MKATWAYAVGLAALLSQGCDKGPASQTSSPTAGQAQNGPPAPAPPVAPVSQPGSSPPVPAPSVTTSSVESGTAPPAPPTPPKTVDTSNREAAKAGVGEQGRGYGGAGFVTTPIEAKFRTEQRIIFEIQIPYALDLYKAEHNNKGPKTNAEFMRYIIEENSIQLPELPAGDSYIYDPVQQQLMVQHPRK